MRLHTVRAAVPTLLPVAALYACGGNPRNPAGARAVNHTPEVRSLLVDPPVIHRGGVAMVMTMVTDADGDPLTCIFEAAHGTLTVHDAAATCNGATYRNDGQSASSDQIRVTATDRNNVSASAVAGIAILGSSAQPTPTPRPAPPSTMPPSPDPRPTPEPAPSATPVPTPSPSPTATPSPNQPPTVSVTGHGQTCHPNCTAAFAAQASDPNGDPLTYSWSGCASGTNTAAQCSIDGLSTYTATVTVSDGRGGVATASASATGTNAKPIPQCPGELHGQGNHVITIPVSASDPDDPGGSLQCEAVATGAPMQIFNVTCSRIDAKTCNPSSPPGCYSVIYFSAYDPFGANASCSFVLWGDSP